MIEKFIARVEIDTIFLDRIWIAWGEKKILIAGMKHHDQKELCVKRVHFHVTVRRRKSRQELKPGRNLEAGADVGAMEGCCLLSCSS